MFFVLSKIVWALVEPTDLLLLAFLAGTLLLWLGRDRAARFTLTGASLLLLTVTLLPVGQALLIPLEQRFPPPARLPARIDGIILLGGAQRPLLTRAHHQPALSDAAETMTTFLALARAYPKARLVFAGGSGDPLHQDVSEADTVRMFLRQQGFAPDRVLYERRSRNTYQNAAFAKRLVRPRPGQRWVLVTTAYGMPRAVGVFRAAGWPVIPYPCDYRTVRHLHWTPGLSFADSLSTLAMALHEWLGLTAYYLTGRSSALFPGPTGAGYSSLWRNSTPAVARAPAPITAMGQN